jgi:hypothetical protein
MNMQGGEFSVRQEILKQFGFFSFPGMETSENEVGERVENRQNRHFGWVSSSTLDSR